MYTCFFQVIRVLGVLFFFFSFEVSGQVTRTSGYWDDPSIWTDGVVPSSDAATIEVGTTHRVILRDQRTVARLAVNGELVISHGAGLHFEDASGTGLNVSGRLEVLGSLEGCAGFAAYDETRIVFKKGAVYRQLCTTREGSIPLATWDADATLEVSGYTSVQQATEGGNWGQAFGNLIWDTPNLVTPFDLKGTLKQVRGNLNLRSTGSQYLLLSSMPGRSQLQVGGSVSITHNASLELSNLSLADVEVVAAGNVAVNTSGYVSLGIEGTGTFRVGGDLQVEQGTFRETGQATGNIVFEGMRYHRFQRGPTGEGGAFSGRINYMVPAGDTLDVGQAVLANGVGNSNANALVVAGTLILGSTDKAGALQANTLGGNVRTTVSRRSFLPGSRLIYRSHAPMYLGDGGAASYAETYIDNPLGVSVLTHVTLQSRLVLERGPLRIDNTGALTLSGGVETRAGFFDVQGSSELIIRDSIAAPVDLYFGDNDGAMLGIFTIDRRFPGAMVSVRNSVRIGSLLNLVNGELRNHGNLYLSGGVNVSRWPGAVLTGTGLTGGKPYHVTYRTQSGSSGPFAVIQTGLELPADPAMLGILKVQTAQNQDSIKLVSDITVNESVEFNKGCFYAGNHVMRFNGATWSDNGGTFGQGRSRVIFAGDASVQGSTNSTFHTIQVLSGARLRFVKNTTISGDIEFLTGSIVEAASTTLYLNGTSTQRIAAGGARIGSLVVTKAEGSDIQLQSPLNLTGVLRFNSPSKNIDFKSGGFLCLLSAGDQADSAANGVIYRLQDGNTVSGEVAVQRYMAGEGRIYRYISSSVKNATVASWKDDFPITGNFLDPSAAATICGVRVKSTTPSLFLYDEIRGDYVAYPAPGRYSTASPLEPGRGYAAFIRQCDSPVVAEVVGVINQQRVDLPVSYSGGTEAPGWNLVGNPYPCPIDWDLTSQGWIKTRISPAIAIRDNGKGRFLYWDGDPEDSEIADGRIASGQAFWVRAVGPAPVLAVREGVKVTQQAEFFRQPTGAATPAVVLYLEHGGEIDRAFIKLKPGGRPGIDSLDAPKLNNDLFDLATQSTDSVLMAINVIGDTSCVNSVPIVIKDALPGMYKLRMTARGVFERFIFKLKDIFLQREILMDSAGYDFEVSGTSMTYGGSRFILSWEPRPAGVIAVKERVQCDGELVRIEVEGRQPATRYALWEADTELSDSLVLLPGALGDGDHYIRVSASGICYNEFLSGSVLVRRRHPAIERVAADTACYRGRSVLSSSGSGKDHRVRWFQMRQDGSRGALVCGEATYVTEPLTASAFFIAVPDAAGCEGRPVPVAVPVRDSLPLSLTIAGRYLKSSLPLGNRWFFNGRELPTEAGFMVVMDEPGLYSVVNNAGGCEVRTDYRFGGLNGALRLYPNPATDKIVLETDSDDIQSIGLYSLEGRLLAEFDLRGHQNQKMGIFDVENLKPGHYYLRITLTNKDSRVLGFVKL